ncbi:MAG: organomercurial lyase, partial [Desulfotomaculaceae bacterium]|nr:organomercurial lyase [Desulfotomaculaceae bacterium]
MKRFKNYPDERLIIDSISSRLTGAERLLRLCLLEQIIESGAPVNLNSLKQTEELQQLDTDDLIKSMVAKRVIVPDEEGNINFAYPVSAL